MWLLCRRLIVIVELLLLLMLWLLWHIGRLWLWHIGWLLLDWSLMIRWLDWLNGCWCWLMMIAGRYVIALEMWIVVSWIVLTVVELGRITGIVAVCWVLWLSLCSQKCMWWCWWGYWQMIARSLETASEVKEKKKTEFKIDISNTNIEIRQKRQLISIQRKYQLWCLIARSIKKITKRNHRARVCWSYNSRMKPVRKYFNYLRFCFFHYFRLRVGYTFFVSKLNMLYSMIQSYVQCITSYMPNISSDAVQL